MSENITAVVTLNATEYDPEDLDRVLKVLAKNGLHPRYYEPEPDELPEIASKFPGGLTVVPTDVEINVKQDVISEHRTTEYDSEKNTTRVALVQVIRGELKS